MKFAKLAPATAPAPRQHFRQDRTGESEWTCKYGGFVYDDLPPGEHHVETNHWGSPGACALALNMSAGYIDYFGIRPRAETSYDANYSFDAISFLFGNGLLMTGVGLADLMGESNKTVFGGPFKLYRVGEYTGQNRLKTLRQNHQENRKMRCFIQIKTLDNR